MMTVFLVRCGLGFDHDAGYASDDDDDDDNKSYHRESC